MPQQTTILQHFSPQSAESSRMARAYRRDQSSESEGSEGLTNIKLNKKRRLVEPDKRTMSQKRVINKVVVDSEGDTEEEDAGKNERVEAGKTPSQVTVDDDDTSSEIIELPTSKPKTRKQISKPAPKRETRRPAPIIIVPPNSNPQPTSQTSSRRTLSQTLSIELPSLTPEQRSMYTATSLSSSHLPTPATARKGKARFISPAESSEDEAPQRKASKKAVKKKSQAKRRTVDPDEEPATSKSSSSRKPKPSRHDKVKLKRKNKVGSDYDAETDEEDVLAELEMDEPERFKSDTRLRGKTETAMQRHIRKMREKKEGVITVSSDSEEEDEGSSSDSDTNSEDSRFIIDDGGKVEEGLLPHEFSNNSAQTPEFKFKVVFHYFVHLVLNGPSVIPLTGDAETYFGPQLGDLRRRMESYRDGRVRSQIWRKNFVEALSTFPMFRTTLLDEAEPGCDACHMSGRRSRFRVCLEGEEYDSDTHQSLSSGSESETHPEDKLPKEFLMGKFCKRRAEVYHAMCHWEHDLFHRIRAYYHDLLRAKNRPVPEDSDATSSGEESTPEAEKRRRSKRAIRRMRTTERIERLRRGPLPEKVKNEDEVLDWMDDKGYQSKDFRWLEALIEESRVLEHDKSRDE